MIIGALWKNDHSLFMLAIVHPTFQRCPLNLVSFSLVKLNAQEGAEMEGFVMRGVSVSALMDSMALTVRKVKALPWLAP